MGIIKEQTDKYCVIRTRIYSSSLSQILELFDVAKNDFPDIKPTDVSVVCYGGEPHKRKYGLEFEKSKRGIVPEDYKPVGPLEKTL